MGLINNDKLYPVDTRVTINDNVIGSDNDENGVTRNYPMSGIVSLINEVNDLKFSLYKYSNKDANIKKGVFNISGPNFKFSDIDQENNNNRALFSIIAANKENIILNLKDGTENFAYYNIISATSNTESYTFELQVINNIKAGSYILENNYVFNIGITTSTLAQVQSDYLQSDNSKPDFIKNIPISPTLVEGSNITITKDDSANTITIASTGSGGGGGRTDLSYVPDTRTLESSSGNNAILPLSNSSQAGLMKANFYEEGNFSPKLKYGSGAGTEYTVGTTFAEYVRVGNTVTVTITFSSINTVGIPTGFLKITPLPFISIATNYGNTSIIAFSGSTLTTTELSRLRFIATSNLLQFNFVETFGSISAMPITSGTLVVGLTYKTNVYTP